MSDESQSASNRPVPRREHTKPTLITIGNRQVTSNGRWNNACLAQFLMLAENRLRWIGIGELAKTAWGQNSINNKKKARMYLFRLFNYLLAEEGRLLVVKYEGGGKGNGHPRAKEVKLYDPASSEERLMLEVRLARMVSARDLTEERYRQALALMA